MKTHIKKAKTYSDNKIDFGIDEIITVLKKYPAVAFAYLYGSYLDNPEVARDIDVAVGLKGVDDLHKALQITGDIKEELLNRLPLPLDLRVLNFATVSFMLDVVQDGQLFYEADEEFLAEFIEDLSRRAVQTITNRYYLEGKFCRV